MTPILATHLLVKGTADHLDKLEEEHPELYQEFMGHLEAAADVLARANAIPPVLRAALKGGTND